MKSDMIRIKLHQTFKNLKSIKLTLMNIFRFFDKPKNLAIFLTELTCDSQDRGWCRGLVTIPRCTFPRRSVPRCSVPRRTFQRRRLQWQRWNVRRGTEQRHRWEGYFQLIFQFCLL